MVHTPVGLCNIIHIICGIHVRFGVVNNKDWLTEVEDDRIINVRKCDYAIERVGEEEKKNKAFEPGAIPAHASAWRRIFKNA